MNKKLKTICLILITIAIIIGIGFYGWATWRKQIYYEKEEVRNRIEECREAGSKAYKEYRELNLGSNFEPPQYFFNEQLGKCIYYGGLVNEFKRELFVRDAYTDENIVSYFMFKGLIDDEEIKKRNLEEYRQFEKNKEQLFSQ